MGTRREKQWYFNDLERLAGESGEINNPKGVIAFLSKEWNVTPSRVLGLLKGFEGEKRIELTTGANSMGRGKMILAITILQKSDEKSDKTSPARGETHRPFEMVTITKSSPLSPLTPQQPEPAQPAEEPSKLTPRTRSEGMKRVALLVDYLNVVKVAEEAGYVFPFGQLREYVRKFGCIELPFAFLPPNSYQQRNDEMWEANLIPITCPMSRTKDERGKMHDLVDIKLLWLAQKLAEHPWMDTIIVVSEDGDFSDNTEFKNFVKDRGMELVFLNPRTMKDELAPHAVGVVQPKPTIPIAPKNPVIRAANPSGHHIQKAAVKLRPFPFVNGMLSEELIRALGFLKDPNLQIDLLQKDMLAGDTKHYVRFMCDVIDACERITGVSQSLPLVEREATRSLDQLWNLGVQREIAPKLAIRILLDENVLQNDNSMPEDTCFPMLNRKHSVFLKAQKIRREFMHIR